MRTWMAVVAVVSAGLATSAVVAIGPEPAAAGGNVVAFNNQAPQAVTLHDAASGELLASVPTGVGPHELAVSPDGAVLVVSNYGQQKPGNTLTVMSMADLSSPRTIDLGDHLRPHGLAFLPDGKRVVVTSEMERCIVVVDLATGAVEQRIDTDQAGSHMVALSPDGARAYVTNVGSGSLSVIDFASGTLVRTIPTASGAEGLAVSPDGRTVWVANNQGASLSVVDAEAMEVRHSLDCAGFPIRLAFTPDGKHVLAVLAFSGELAVFDARTRERTHTIDLRQKDKPVPQEHPQLKDSPLPLSIWVSKDGARALVSCKAANFVAVVDLERFVVTGRFDSPGAPDGVVETSVRTAEGEVEAGRMQEK